MKAEYVDHMGNDLSVVNAARVSFSKIATELLESEQGLIKYLAKHKHWTPFAHTAVTLRMSAPVPIRTQCFKHKVGMVENEESRRYISNRPEVFVPEFFRSKPEGSIKQGSADKHTDSEAFREIYQRETARAIRYYMLMINEGVCPEQARLILPQGCIVNWIWTGNLMSFANFFNGRTDSHAQAEIQDLARLVGAEIQPLFPYSWEALTNGN